MNTHATLTLVFTLILTLVDAIGAEQAKSTSPPAIPDPRHITNGRNIPSEGYADQPYIVKTDDGAWLCVMTTGVGAEGAGGQHVVSMRSTDLGRTWSDIVPIEPADGPEASYAVLLKVPYGRIYVFYNHNTDRVPEVKREDKGVYKRVDSLGHYVFKYSDDHGRTWSAKRYEVPLREFECDRNNVYGGKLRFFWNVGRPLILCTVRGRVFQEQEHPHRPRPGEDHVRDAARWRHRPAHAHRRRSRRGGTKHRQAQRWLALLRLSHGGRLADNRV